MEKNAQRRGSVLMEFIIVFPIYLVLFAGTVAIGDMLIHSNRLIPSDRLTAYEVDGRAAGYAAIGRRSDAMALASLRWIADGIFHPRVEIADDGSNQDSLRQLSEPHYADTTGPWSVCAAATAYDIYKPLAGGTLGQLLSARALLGGAGGSVLSELGGGVGMWSKDRRNGAAFYTLKRRDHYWQRLFQREGFDEFVRADARNWRDRSYISRLLRTQGGRLTENWRIEVEQEGWHSAATINGGTVKKTCSEAYGENIPGYKRYPTFDDLSD